MQAAKRRGKERSQLSPLKPLHAVLSGFLSRAGAGGGPGPPYAEVCEAVPSPDLPGLGPRLHN